MTKEELKGKWTVGCRIFPIASKSLSSGMVDQYKKVTGVRSDTRGFLSCSCSLEHFWLLHLKKVLIQMESRASQGSQQLHLVLDITLYLLGVSLNSHSWWEFFVRGIAAALCGWLGRNAGRHTYARRLCSWACSMAHPSSFIEHKFKYSAIQSAKTAAH